MIAGLGTDMIEVERVAKKIARGAGFRELVFSANEIKYCESRASPNEHYAARFAAKEAFFKALGTGWLNGTAFHEIEVGHDLRGKPVFAFLGQTADTIAAMNLKSISLSLTHLKEIASAVVIIEQ
jgi:holo-[acyl-carrier protein] synthase